MLVAGAVDVDGGSPRRARLKVIEGFGKGEIHAFVLAAVAPKDHCAAGRQHDKARRRSAA
jgi:hypothetical protein